jgi:hypothetical protein
LTARAQEQRALQVKIPPLFIPALSG